MRWQCDRICDGNAIRIRIRVRVRVRIIATAKARIMAINTTYLSHIYSLFVFDFKRKSKPKKSQLLHWLIIILI